MVSRAHSNLYNNFAKIAKEIVNMDNADKAKILIDKMAYYYYTEKPWATHASVIFIVDDYEIILKVGKESHGPLPQPITLIASFIEPIERLNEEAEDLSMRMELFTDFKYSLDKKASEKIELILEQLKIKRANLL